MSLSVVPVLEDLRAIYELEQPMARYNRYVDLMLNRDGEVLPLGDFSPMGKRQKDFLDACIALDAEALAIEECKSLARTQPTSAKFGSGLTAGKIRRR